MPQMLNLFQCWYIIHVWKYALLLEVLESVPEAFPHGPLLCNGDSIEFDVFTMQSSSAIAAAMTQYEKKAQQICIDQAIAKVKLR